VVRARLKVAISALVTETRAALPPPEPRADARHLA
jgi:hypothetical protein